jgi:hypothetical protein
MPFIFHSIYGSSKAATHAERTYLGGPHSRCAPTEQQGRMPCMCRTRLPGALGLFHRFTAPQYPPFRACGSQAYSQLPRQMGVIHRSRLGTRCSVELHVGVVVALYMEQIPRTRTILGEVNAAWPILALMVIAELVSSILIHPSNEGRAVSGQDISFEGSMGVIFAGAGCVEGNPSHSAVTK